MSKKHLGAYYFECSCGFNALTNPQRTPSTKLTCPACRKSKMQYKGNMEMRLIALRLPGDKIVYFHPGLWRRFVNWVKRLRGAKDWIRVQGGGDSGRR